MPLPPFQTVVDQHSAPLWRFLRASVGPTDADDCLQETLISALDAYPRLRAGSNVRAWLFTIARNKALDAHRSRARRPLPVDEVPDAPAPSADGDDPWPLVRELPPKQRSAIALRYAGDLSYREIGGVIDCSEEAARRNVHEGLRKLREVWT